MLREKLHIDAQLVKGSGGIFEVAVDGKIVAKKTLAGFPLPDEIVEAVRAALGDGPPP